jgi:hypothetical protein
VDRADACPPGEASGVLNRYQSLHGIRKYSVRLPLAHKARLKFILSKAHDYRFEW